MRPARSAGRKIMHHVLARLVQDEPGARPDDDPANGPGLLMEWAVGKNYDIYRPDTGKLLLPGAKIWWEMHMHAVGEEIRDHVELAVYLYPKGEEPKYRTRLTLFGRDVGSGTLDIPPNTVAENAGFHVLKPAGAARKFPAAHAPARQGDGDGSDPAGRHHADAQLRGSISTSTG